MNDALVQYDRMRSEVAMCARIDEAAEMRDKAAALAAYARQRDDKELDLWMSEIRLRATMQIGKLSTQVEEAQLAGRGTISLPASGKTKAQVLAEAGISTSTAHRYEELAGGPDAAGQAAGFAAADHYFAEQRAKEEPASMEGLRKAVRAAVRSTMGVPPDAKPPRRKKPPVEAPQPANDAFTEWMGSIDRLAHLPFDAIAFATEAHRFPASFVERERENGETVRLRITAYLQVLEQFGGSNVETE
jgi:hypothetical protein